MRAGQEKEPAGKRREIRSFMAIVEESRIHSSTIPLVASSTEFFVTKHLDFVNVNNGGEVPEVVLFDVLKNSLAYFGSANDLNLCIRPCPVAWTRALRSVPVDHGVGVASCTEIMNLLHDLALDGIVDDDCDALHGCRFHVLIFLQLSDVMPSLRNHHTLMVPAASVKSAPAIKSSAAETTTMESSSKHGTHRSPRIAAAKA
jgi:hypothetical protein